MPLTKRITQLWSRRPRILGGQGYIEHLWLRRPKWLLRGMALKEIPAVPFDVGKTLEAAAGLLARKQELQAAMKELSNIYTIAGVTDSAHDFLFRESLADKLDESVDDVLDDGARGLKELTSLLHASPGRMLKRRDQAIHVPDDEVSYGLDLPETALALDDPKQWTMSWTNFKNVARDARPFVEQWANSLTDVDVANEAFWPMIADYGLPYNLLILQKVRPGNVADLKRSHGDGWSDALQEIYDAGNLYVIDMSIFQHVKPHRAEGFDRFTPSTTTFLVQDPTSKTLTPISVRVSGHEGPSTYFVPTDPAWLYALQAAKVSITVWGIWLGHVYHWHIVTAAMQMTMYNFLTDDHPVYQLLEPQSQHLIGFDNVLILVWKQIGPPTSLTNPRRYLRLTDRFAQGRNFFDDDPKATLARFGIEESDFTVDEPWDKYPLVGHLLTVWDATEAYVGVFVQETYADDASVVGDAVLQKWIRKSSHKRKGNVRGLPPMTNRSALQDVLTSLVYRITVHGVTRLNPSLNPAQTFIANYPPCLQKKEIPAPDSVISTKVLLEYLPRTGVIGQMTQFYYIFVFSSPYEPFIPEGGVEDKLFFEGGAAEPRNAALISFRKEILEFMTSYDGGTPQRGQWPMSVET